VAFGVENQGFSHPSPFTSSLCFHLLLYPQHPAMAFYVFNLYYIFALLIAAIIDNAICNHPFHPLHNIPSPFWASITGGWYLYHA